MQEILAHIEDEEKALEECQQRFRVLAGRLGLSISHHEGEQIIIAPTMRQNVLDKEAECTALEEEIRKKHEVMDSLKNEKQAEETLSVRWNEASTSLDDLRSRLGAIAFEQSQAGALPAEAVQAAAPIIEEYTSLSEKAERGNIVAKLRLASLKKNFGLFCTRVFTALEKSGFEDTLSGERAAVLIAEYRKALAAEKEYRDLLEESRSRSGHSSLVLSEGESAEKLSERLGLLTAELDEAAISYGTYLFDNGGKWISGETTDEQLDLITEMLEERKQEEACNKAIASFRARAQADDYRDLIERNMQNISVLQHEIARLSLQIEEIEQENKVHMQRIRELEAGV